MRKRTFIIFLIITIPFLLSADNGFQEAIALFHQQDYEEARRIFESLAEKDKKDSQIQYYLGRLELIDNHYDKAKRHFERAIDLKPDESDYHLWLAKTLMRKIPHMSFFGKVKNSMKIKKELDRAIEIDSTNLSALMMRYSMYINSYGKGPVTKGMLIKEAQFISKIDASMGHIAFAKYHQLIRENEKAEERFMKAMELNPNDRRVSGSYAVYLKDLGRNDESIQFLTHYLKDHPDDLKMNFELGVTLLLSSKNYDRAKNSFEKALNLQSDDGMPTKAIIHWCLGAAYHLLNQKEKAQKEWKLVHKIDPKFDDVLKAVPELKEIKEAIEGE